MTYPFILGIVIKDGSLQVNLCLLDSVESISQGIKVLYKTTGGSKVNPNSFGSEINSILVTNEKKNWNKRCDRLAAHVVLLSAKNRMYKQNTHTNTYTKWS